MEKRMISSIVNVLAKMGYSVTINDVLNAVKYGSIWHEPCDCGSHIRHNNGGNYHRSVDLWRFNGGYAIVKTNSREDFPMDNYASVFVNKDNASFEVVRNDRLGDEEKEDFSINASRDSVVAVVLDNGLASFYVPRVRMW